MQGAAVVTVLHENLVHSNSSTLYCIHTMCMIMQYAHNLENYEYSVVSQLKLTFL